MKPATKKPTSTGQARRWVRRLAQIPATARLRRATSLIAAPERWFVLVALTFGLAFALTMQLYDAPDEPAHIFRAYQLSQGHLLPEKRQDGTGGQVPLGLVYLYTSTVYSDNNVIIYPHGSDPRDAPDYKLQHERSLFVRFENTALYNPIPYLPHIAALTVGKAFDVTARQAAYMVRIFNLVAYVALVFLAIRLLPFGKWAGVAIGLLPMHVLLAGSMSSDPVSTGILMVWVAAILKIRGSQNPLRPVQLALLALLIITVALIKLPFPLLLGLLFLVPTHAFGTLGRRVWFVGGSLAMAALLCAGWFALSKAYSSSYGPPWANEAGQIAFITQHPLQFVRAIFNSFFTDASDKLLQQYVLSVGWLNDWLPQWTAHLYTVFLALAIWPLRAGDPVARLAVLGRLQKIWVMALGAGCIFVSAAIVYITWTGVGSQLAEGLQARYVTPLLILLIPLAGVTATRQRPPMQSMLATAALRWVPVMFLVCGLMISLHWSHGIETPLTIGPPDHPKPAAQP